MQVVWQNDGGSYLKWGLGFDSCDRSSQFLYLCPISKSWSSSVGDNG